MKPTFMNGVKIASAAACLALVLSACSSTPAESGSSEGESGAAKAESGDSSDDGALKIATLLPQTGSLGFMMPAVLAGIDAAVEDIDAAGGVLGKPIEIVQQSNEGDGNDITIVEKGADEVLASGASFVLGPMSSSRAIHVVDKITGEKVLMGTPSNTASELSGVSEYYFRTAPPDSVQGNALAQQILSDGVTSVAFLTFNDAYGIGLRDTIQGILEQQGVEVVYGGKGEGNEFPVEQTSFSSEVSAIKDADPDAIVIVTFDQITAIVPELVNQGVDVSKAYLVDGNANGFEEVFEPGTMLGVQGSIPGAQADDEFKTRLLQIYKDGYGEDLVSFTYAPEAYDLITIVALAAEKAGSADPTKIQPEIAAVTGANGGTEVTSFAEGKAAIEAGEEIHYVGKAGTGPLNSDNDPSSAFIGIYKYDDKNTPVFQKAVEGSTE